MARSAHLDAVGAFTTTLATAMDVLASGPGGLCRTPPEGFRSNMHRAHSKHIRTNEGDPVTDHDNHAPGMSAITRRKVLASMATAVAAGLVSPSIFRMVSAQDSAATPEAVSGEGVAVPTPSGGALPAIPPEIQTFANDWPMAQANYAATRTSASSPIDSSNVDQLGVAWSYPLDATSGWGAITSNPIVVGNTIFVIDNVGNVHSLDRETGAVNWRNDYNVSTLGPNGVAVGYGYLISVLGDTAEVLCLLQETGEEVWRFQLTNHSSLGISMAPFVFDGYVIVSTAPGGNSKGVYGGGADGIVFCLDIKTGTTLWQWNTVTDDAWGNFRINSGGGLWYPPSVDVETGVLYMGIGNPGPFFGRPEYPNGSSRPGPNDYANNLVALDPNAGHLLWTINVKPHDLFDHDNQQTPVLADVPNGDSIVKMVFSSGKHGFVVGADRTSGVEVWRVPIGKHLNDTVTALGDELVEVYPGVSGGVQGPLAYANGVVFAGILNASTKFSSTVLDYSSFSLATATGNVVAIDALTGQIVWDVELPTGIAGPGPTIANDVLFIAGLDGVLRAFDTADGALIWSIQLPAGANAPFAIANDLLLVPAGSFFLPSSDSTGEPTQPLPQVVAFKLGATGAVTMGPAIADTAGAGTPAAAEADLPTDVTVEMRDIFFDPSQFSIPADTDVALTLPNLGAAVHNFNVDANLNPSDPNIHSGDVNPGDTVTLTINLPSGKWLFYCNIPGHAAAGMAGIITAV
jgi:outer membrane protein assembly factor BamB